MGYHHCKLKSHTLKHKPCVMMIFFFFYQVSLENHVLYRIIRVFSFSLIGDEVIEVCSRLNAHRLGIESTQCQK